MNKDNDYKPEIYTIPTNFIESGRIFNGMFKTRNFIEALIALLVCIFIINLFPISSTPAKIIAIIGGGGPVTLLFLTGIGNEPTSTYLKSMIKWRRNRRVMLYNRNADAQRMRAIDALMQKNTPKDVLAARIAEWQRKRQEELERLEFDETEVDFYTDRSVRAINEFAEKMNRGQPEHRAETVVQPESQEATQTPDVLTLASDEDNFGSFS